MNNLARTIWFRLIAIILINAFFCLDISWAAGGNLKGVFTHLAPAINISGPDVAKEVELSINLRRAYRQIRQGAKHKQSLSGLNVIYSAVLQNKLFIKIDDNHRERVFVVSGDIEDPAVLEIPVKKDAVWIAGLSEEITIKYGGKIIGKAVIDKYGKLPRGSNPYPKFSKYAGSEVVYETYVAGEKEMITIVYIFHGDKVVEVRRSIVVDNNTGKLLYVFTRNIHGQRIETGDVTSITWLDDDARLSFAGGLIFTELLPVLNLEEACIAIRTKNGEISSVVFLTYKNDTPILSLQGEPIIITRNESEPMEQFIRRLRGELCAQLIGERAKWRIYDKTGCLVRGYEKLGKEEFNGIASTEQLRTRVPSDGRLDIPNSKQRLSLPPGAEVELVISGCKGGEGKKVVLVKDKHGKEMALENKIISRKLVLKAFVSYYEKNGRFPTLDEIYDELKRLKSEGAEIEKLRVAAVMQALKKEGLLSSDRGRWELTPKGIEKTGIVEAPALRDTEELKKLWRSDGFSSEVTALDPKQRAILIALFNLTWKHHPIVRPKEIAREINAGGEVPEKKISLVGQNIMDIVPPGCIEKIDIKNRPVAYALTKKGRAVGMLLRLLAYCEFGIYRDIETVITTITTPKSKEEKKEKEREKEKVALRLLAFAKDYPQDIFDALKNAIIVIIEYRFLQGELLSEWRAKIRKHLINSYKDGYKNKAVEEIIFLLELADKFGVDLNKIGSREELEVRREDIIQHKKKGEIVVAFFCTHFGETFFSRLSQSLANQRNHSVKNPLRAESVLFLTKKQAKIFAKTYAVLALIEIGVVLFGVWNFIAGGMQIDSNVSILAQLSAVLVMNLPVLLVMSTSGVLAYGYYKAWRLPLADDEVWPSWTQAGSISYSQAVNNLPAFRQLMVKLSLNLYEMGNVLFPRDNELLAKIFGFLPFAAFILGLGLNQIGLPLFAISACLIGLMIYLGLGMVGFAYETSPGKMSPEDFAALRVCSLGAFNAHKQIGAIHRSTGELDGKIILDVGCGAGIPVLFAAVGKIDKYGYPKKVIGIDRVPDAIRAAQEISAYIWHEKLREDLRKNSIAITAIKVVYNLKNEGVRGRKGNIPSNVEFRVADARNLDFLPDSSIDIVTSYEAIDMDEMADVMLEIIRVTKDGGYIHGPNLKHMLDESIVSEIILEFKTRGINITLMPIFIGPKERGLVDTYILKKQDSSITVPERYSFYPALGKSPYSTTILPGSRKPLQPLPVVDEERRMSGEEDPGKTPGVREQGTIRTGINKKEWETRRERRRRAVRLIRNASTFSKDRGVWELALDKLEPLQEYAGLVVRFAVSKDEPEFKDFPELRSIAEALIPKFIEETVGPLVGAAIMDEKEELRNRAGELIFQLGIVRDAAGHFASAALDEENDDVRERAEQWAFVPEMLQYSLFHFLMAAVNEKEEGRRLKAVNIIETKKNIICEHFAPKNFPTRIVESLVLSVLRDSDEKVVNDARQYILDLCPKEAEKYLGERIISGFHARRDEYTKAVKLQKDIRVSLRGQGTKAKNLSSAPEVLGSPQVQNIARQYQISMSEATMEIIVEASRAGLINKNSLREIFQAASTKRLYAEIISLLLIEYAIFKKHKRLRNEWCERVMQIAAEQGWVAFLREHMQQLTTRKGIAAIVEAEKREVMLAGKDIATEHKEERTHRSGDVVAYMDISGLWTGLKFFVQVLGIARMLVAIFRQNSSFGNGLTKTGKEGDNSSPVITLSDGSELSPGDSVAHSTFGQGTIISIVSGVRVIVDFGNAGTKTIAWEFARQYLSPSSGQQVEEKIDPKIAKNIEEMRRHIRENVIDSTIAENVIEI
ncbi:MAG: methyltransferase domain-containing protein, partial [Candidatus Omnitrophota bacterium]